MVKLMVKCKMLLCVQISSLSKQTLSNELEENMNLHALRNYFVHLHLKNLRGGVQESKFRAQFAPKYQLQIPDIQCLSWKKDCQNSDKIVTSLFLKFAFSVSLSRESTNIQGINSWQVDNQGEIVTSCEDICILIQIYFYFVDDKKQVKGRKL